MPPARQEWGLTVRLLASTRGCPLLILPLHACCTHGKLGTSPQAQARRGVIFVQHATFCPPPTTEIFKSTEFKSFDAFSALPTALLSFMNFKCCCGVSEPTAFVLNSAGIPSFSKHLCWSQVSSLHTFLNQKIPDIDVSAPSTNAFSMSSPNRGSQIGANSSSQTDFEVCCQVHHTVHLHSHLVIANSSASPDHCDVAHVWRVCEHQCSSVCRLVRALVTRPLGVGVALQLRLPSAPLKPVNHSLVCLEVPAYPLQNCQAFARRIPHVLTGTLGSELQVKPVRRKMTDP